MRFWRTSEGLSSRAQGTAYGGGGEALTALQSMVKELQGLRSDLTRQSRSQPTASLLDFSQGPRRLGDDY